MTELTTMRPPVGHSSSPMFARSAELVDICERLYRRIFATGLWVATSLSAFAAAVSWLHPTPGAQVRGFLVCGAISMVCALAARRPEVSYRLLRRRPTCLAVAGLVLGVAAWLVGVHNVQLFLPMVGVIGVCGIATPLHVVSCAGLVAGVGLASPQLVDAHANLGGTIVVMVPPLLFWLIVERIAGFALNLHRTLGATSPAPSLGRSQPSATPGPADTASGAPREPRGLPAPRSIEVDGVRLTTRQLQVMLLACEGLRHAEIGVCLGIRPAAVRRHLDLARHRTASATTPQLVAWARRAGLVPGAP